MLRELRESLGLTFSSQLLQLMHYSSSIPTTLPTATIRCADPTSMTTSVKMPNYYLK